MKYRYREPHEMKDSGIEWLGMIPREWELCRLKYLCDIRTGNMDTQDREVEGKYPFYVRSKKIEKSNKYSFDKSEAILTAGDGDIGKIFHYVKGKFACHQRVYKFSDFKKVDAKFLYYYTSENLIKEVKKLSAKTTVDSLRLPMLENFYITYDLDKQREIADFLDKKTAEFDEVVEKKEKFIERLKEAKKSLISEVVTGKKKIEVVGTKYQAINRKPSEMKSSKIEWLGMIPEEWKQTKLRYLGNTKNGISAGANYFGSGFPFISYGDVYNNIELPNVVKGLAKSTKEDQILYSVSEGDVLFTRTSETIEEIGFSSTCMRKIENVTFAGFLIRFRPHKNLLLKEFSKYYFSSSVHRSYFIKNINLVTRASLSQELLKNLPVPLPNLKEQKIIGGYLESKTNEIDKIIDKNKKQIEKLKEAKRSLINETVTGKIEVL